MKWLHVIAFILVIVGALNWGIWALANVNVVNMVVGSMPSVEKVVYILVGLSGLYLVVTHKGDCKCCAAMMKGKK